MQSAELRIPVGDDVLGIPKQTVIVCKDGRPQVAPTTKF